MPRSWQTASTRRSEACSRACSRIASTSASRPSPRAPIAASQVPRLAVEHLQPPVDARVDHRLQARSGALGRHRVRRHPHQRAHDLEVQLALGAEVVVQQARGRPRPPGRCPRWTPRRSCARRTAGAPRAGSGAGARRARGAASAARGRRTSCVRAYQRCWRTANKGDVMQSASAAAKARIASRPPGRELRGHAAERAPGDVQHLAVDVVRPRRAEQEDARRRPPAGWRGGRAESASSPSRASGPGSRAGPSRRRSPSCSTPPWRRSGGSR